jgi:hypothetical protein
VTLTLEQNFSHSLLPISKCSTGVEHVGGDMFESVPSGDAIFIKVLIDSPIFMHGIWLANLITSSSIVLLLLFTAAPRVVPGECR